MNVDYYTECVWESRIEITESLDEYHIGAQENPTDSSLAARLEFGYINVNRQPKPVQENPRTHAGEHRLRPDHARPVHLRHRGFALYPPVYWRRPWKNTTNATSAPGCMGWPILKRTAPSLCLCDEQNIETDVSLTEVGPSEWKSALYLFDTIEGGVGYAEKIFEVFAEALKTRTNHHR